MISCLSFRINIYILLSSLLVEEGVAESLVEEGDGEQDYSKQDEDDDSADSDHFPYIIDSELYDNYAEYAECHQSQQLIVVAHTDYHLCCRTCGERYRYSGAAQLLKSGHVEAVEYDNHCEDAGCDVEIYGVELNVSHQLASSCENVGGAYQIDSGDSCHSCQKWDIFN